MKFKRFFFLFFILICFSGCTKIMQIDYNEIIASVVTSKYNVTNRTRRGYKYYVPSGINSIETNDFNEKLASSKYYYYLYIDVVSYYNRVINEYNINSNAIFSAPINYEDKYGYLEINKLENKKYFIEIMYNYAKIEVMVDKCDLKESITNSIIVLSSINYNNNILESVVGDNALEFNEESYNIFETKKRENDFLDVETKDDHENEEESIEDPDLVD